MKHKKLILITKSNSRTRRYLEIYNTKTPTNVLEMNKWLKNHAKLEKLKRYMNAQNVKNQVKYLHSIFNKLSIG